MAILPDNDRRRIWAGLMRYWSNLREGLPNMSKVDLRAAVDATDDWIEDNQASFNAALPDAFRNNATLDQKTLLFCAVALARVSIEFLRSIVGEVD